MSGNFPLYRETLSYLRGVNSTHVNNLDNFWLNKRVFWTTQNSLGKPGAKFTSCFEMAAEVDCDAMKAENIRLRHTLFVMVTDRQKMASKLTGVQNLGQQLQKKEIENSNLREKIERIEGSLARAENRITQLSLQAGNGQHLSGQTAIVTPGVSKKVLEALTRDNTRLKQALDHLTNRGPAGVDLAVVSEGISFFCKGRS